MNLKPMLFGVLASNLVYNRKHYFGLDPKPKLKPNPKRPLFLGQYCNKLKPHLKGEI